MRFKDNAPGKDWVLAYWKGTKMKFQISREKLLLNILKIYNDSQQRQQEKMLKTRSLQWSLSKVLQQTMTVLAIHMTMNQ